MKCKSSLFIFLILCVCVLSVIGNVDKKPFYLPEYNQIVKKTGFTLSYSEKHEQPNWVAYKMSKENLKGEAKRKSFKKDTAIETGSAELEDYKGSGYDRGHLAPAAIMVWSDIAMAESFLLSNISPQEQSFNRGVWKRLDNLLEKWVISNDSIFVITGPVLKETMGKIGKNNVSVPKYFYKVVLKFCPNDKKAIGFLVPHKKSDKPLHKFAVTVDKIEEITNIDFFESMDDTLENRIEGTFDYYTW